MGESIPSTSCQTMNKQRSNPSVKHTLWVLNINTL